VIIATGTHWTAASVLPAALAEDRRCGLAFYDYPTEHWVHLRPRTRSSQLSRP
jgi:hypothetical protein